MWHLRWKEEPHDLRVAGISRLKLKFISYGRVRVGCVQRKLLRWSNFCVASFEMHCSLHKNIPKEERQLLN